MWDIIPMGDDYFSLKNRQSGKCLDVYGLDGGKGNNIATYDCEYVDD